MHYHRCICPFITSRALEMGRSNGATILLIVAKLLQAFGNRNNLVWQQPGLEIFKSLSEKYTGAAYDQLYKRLSSTESQVSLKVDTKTLVDAVHRLCRLPGEVARAHPDGKPEGTCASITVLYSMLLRSVTLLSDSSTGGRKESVDADNGVCLEFSTNIQ